ncbi:transcription antitermination factor NusB [Allobaculum mucilyticum]|nr:transcription antitermination factor NusB [Allobaculum mucilyticum]
MLKYRIPFNRHQMREIALEAIYQNLLLGKDIRRALYDVLDGSNEVNGYLYSLAVGTIENKDEYIELLSKKLRSDWTFERLPLLEQAILLMSTQEILENGTPKAAVINEAITLTKEYCDAESPKLINAILDSLPNE